MSLYLYALVVTLAIEVGEAWYLRHLGTPPRFDVAWLVAFGFVYLASLMLVGAVHHLATGLRDWWRRR